MNYAVEMVSGPLMHIPSFIHIGSAIQVNRHIDRGHVVA
jgi:hypothetical protein